MSNSNNEWLKCEGQVILTGAYGNDVILSLTEGIKKETIDISITPIPDF